MPTVAPVDSPVFGVATAVSLLLLLLLLLFCPPDPGSLVLLAVDDADVAEDLVESVAGATFVYDVGQHFARQRKKNGKIKTDRNHLDTPRLNPFCRVGPPCDGLLGWCLQRNVRNHPRPHHARRGGRVAPVLVVPAHEGKDIVGDTGGWDKSVSDRFFIICLFLFLL